MCLAQLSYTDDNVPASGQLIHDRIPIALELLYLLLNMRLLSSEAS